jgi:hypothetical protein
LLADGVLSIFGCKLYEFLKGEEIMLKIAHVREVEALRGLPSEVIDVIRDAVIILDTEYGEHRDVDGGDGGYVLIVESKDDLEELIDFKICVKTSMPEYVDSIKCGDGQMFTSTMVMLSDDYSIIVVMILDLLRDTNWMAYIE